MKREWVMRQQENGNWFDNLVISRGLKLDFDYERDLPDPFLMLDMDKAVARLRRAMENDERVMIFADYDADGVPGAAILAKFFEKINFTNFIVYLPDRHIEDYGLSCLAIDEAVREKVKLIITIDCGIANATEVAYAREKNIEVIVTDHHLVPDKIPEAVAVLDPKRDDDNYPNKNLCGAGVIFKLIQAMIQEFRRSDLKYGFPRSDLKELPMGWEKWLLDLVAIATVSDMVPLVGENRALVHFGLRVLRRSPRPGIVELFRALRLRQENVTEDDIAFSVGPRINAASRMAHAREAFELLTTNDVAVAATIAARLEKLNKERRKCVDEILSNVGNFSPVLGNNPQTVRKVPDVLVLGHESWSLGVLGLTASRLVETHARPVFIWGKNGNGLIKGSCRSDGSVNVVELMRSVEKDFFVNIGGHHQAGGFSLLAEKLPELESRLLAAWETLTRTETNIATLPIDAELSISEVTMSLYRQLERLAPFGLENPKPVFLFHGVKIIEAKKFGNGQAHLELVVADELGKKLTAISFFNTFKHFDFLAGQEVDLAATVELSFFRYQPELRLRIIDVR